MMRLGLVVIFEKVVVVVVVSGRMAKGLTGDVGWGPIEEGEGESEIRRGAAVVVEETEGGVGTTK